jgi:polyphosphate kinase 2
MLLRYTQFINEELRIEDVDPTTLDTLKSNFLTRLGEYKTFILANINYNFETNKVEYRDFDKIEVPVMMRELSNEFSEELIEELNLQTFLLKLNQILELKKRNTKRKIRESFDEYYSSIDKRIEEIRTAGSRDDLFDEFEGEGSIVPRRQYESEKYKIQIELLKLQEWVKKNGKKVVIVFEGRDAAGKGSTIKRFTEYLDPRGFRVVALGIPTEEEKRNWFARYESHFPNPGEIVFFDRSWYNRAVVEPAMGYCTEEQYQDFMDKVTDWEEKMIRNDVILIKLWFSITQDKQIKRFELRQKSPLKYWKFSPNDAAVLDKFEIIGNFKRQMFQQTSSRLSPWVVINSNDKKIGRLNAMRYVLSKINYDEKDTQVSKYYPEVVNILI